MTAIDVCRTAALGGHLDRCTECEHERNCFNSCRDRHCPKCQSLARAQWVEDRRAELLPVGYFHIVFTVPQEIAAIAFQNKELVLGILFRVTAETLRTIAADPTLEMADIIRSAGRDFIERNRSWLNRLHLKVLTAIERCRTAALGGHLDECTGADIVSSRSTRAEIDTAQSVKRTLAIAGSKRVSASFYPHAMSMSSLLCHTNWHRWLCRISG